MLEPFSHSYKIGRAYMDPIDMASEEQVPRLSDNQYQFISDWYGEQGSTLTPILRVGPAHFPVVGDSSLPRDTLKIPPLVIPINRDVPGTHEYLVLKPSAGSIMVDVMDPTDITSSN